MARTGTISSESNASEIPETVEIASIVRDMQVRAKGTNRQVVQDYARAMAAEKPAKFPPIVLYRERGTLLLSDGAHRIEATLLNGGTTIEAIVRTGSRRDCLRHAVSSAGEFGLRFSTADKRRAIELMLKAFPKMKAAEVARAIGVDEKTVSATKRRIEAAPEIPANVGPVDSDAKIVSKLTTQIDRAIGMWPDTRHDALRALLARWSEAMASTIEAAE